MIVIGIFVIETHRAIRAHSYKDEQRRAATKSREAIRNFSMISLVFASVFAYLHHRGISRKVESPTRTCDGGR